MITTFFLFSEVLTHFIQVAQKGMKIKSSSLSNPGS